MTRCPYCGHDVDYAAHLGECVAVRFALDPTFTIYSGGHSIDHENTAKYRGVAPSHALLQRRPASTYQPSPRSLAGLCARDGCDEKRAEHGPYCRAHRREIDNASHAKHRASINARERARRGARRVGA